MNKNLRALCWKAFLTVVVFGIGGVPSLYAYNQEAINKALQDQHRAQNKANLIEGLNEMSEKERIEQLAEDGKISWYEAEQLLIERERLSLDRKKARTDASVGKNVNCRTSYIGDAAYTNCD